MIFKMRIKIDRNCIDVQNFIRTVKMNFLTVRNNSNVVIVTCTKIEDIYIVYKYLRQASRQKGLDPIYLIINPYENINLNIEHGIYMIFFNKLNKEKYTIVHNLCPRVIISIYNDLNKLSHLPTSPEMVVDYYFCHS